MRLGIAIEETWGFFDEIYKNLSSHYETSVLKVRSWKLPIFNTRISRYFFEHDLKKFMQANDVVYFEWASRLLVVASGQPKVCGIVTRLHRYEMYTWANRINWDVVDKIIVVSHAKQREFASKFPKQAAKIVVSSPSISLDKFIARPKYFNGDIGILCHLSPRKRVYELILTFYELICDGYDLHLHIGGGADPAFEDYYGAILSLVEKLNLKERVTFYGNVRDPWNWYQHIDIFISNSYSEGLQVALMEALASGCYCLAHRWDGAEEMLPENQLYYSEGELVRKIKEYCKLTEAEKQSSRKTMREIACEKFDINQTIAQFRRAIDEVGAAYNKNRVS
jgi:glycosyltransferase involved in cell wall biosynthesis